jgi:hypothetical protein
MQLPPELMTPEQRDARADELRGRVSREWWRFAITEAVFLWIPFAVFVVLYLRDAVSGAWLVPAVIVAVAISAGLVGYWLARRIMPLLKELDALETSAGGGASDG